MNGLSVSHFREASGVRILMHMRNRNLRSPLKRATDMATASLSDVAEGMGRKLRTLQAYRSGFRDVTPDAARALAAYLRKRARLLQRAADSLEAAAERATRKEEDDATP